MKTGGIVVCSTLVALVPEHSYGRSVTQPTKKQIGLTPSRLALWHGLVSYSRSSDKIRTATSLKAWFLPSSFLPPWSSSIRWVIPCSHVRVFARRLGRHLRGSSHLDSTRTLVPRPLIR
ncbi:hypothetical protein HN51_043422 [Arachis hypogaea]